MRYLVSGGTGLIGSALVESLIKDGHQVTILTRRPDSVRLPAGAQAVGWDGKTTAGWGELVARVDGILNLAGENIGAGVWTGVRKAAFISSRAQAGLALTEAIRAASPRPSVFVQASAVGFYGPHGREPVTEADPIGGDFMAEICRAWEASSQPVEALGVRRVVVRTGVVLAKRTGALPRLLLPFRLFAGGPLGNGWQGIPWIHLADEVAALRFLLDHPECQGAYNLSAPQPLSNADFGKVIAKVLKRPYWLPAPSFALRLVLGEMSTLVLDGQFMLPERLLSAGFHFQFESAEAALQEILTK